MNAKSSDLTGQETGLSGPNQRSTAGELRLRSVWAYNRAAATFFV